MDPSRRPEPSELVSLAARGDPEAQRALVERLNRRTRAIALAILGNHADAEDATQNTLLEVLGAAAGYRGGSFLAWADRIAVRTAMRYARKRRLREARHDSDAPLEQLVVEGRAPAAHAVPRPIVDYLAELPETRRVALVLRHVMGYSIDEIAELTGVSPNTVKDRLLQGREQLRKNIRREIAIGVPRSGGRS